MFSVLNKKSLESVAGFWLHAQNRMQAVRSREIVLFVDFMDVLFKIRANIMFISLIQRLHSVLLLSFNRAFFCHFDRAKRAEKSLLLLQRRSWVGPGGAEDLPEDGEYGYGKYNERRSNEYPRFVRHPV